MNSLKSLKFNKWLMIALVATTFLSTSCDNDDEDDTVVITVDDAAELVAFSLANRTYGLVHTLNNVAEEVLDLVDCNESQSSSDSVSDSSSDGEVSVTYELTEDYSKDCEGEETVNYGFSIQQVLSSVRFDYDIEIIGTWTIAGVQDGSTEITYNGPYDRSGLYTYNLQDDHTDDVSYNSTMNDVTYSPDLERITGGTSTFSMEGTSTVYEPYAYGGTVEFQGSDISIITFDTGEQYELNLETGEVTEL